ncbi:MAG: hypothetical protein RL839_02780 [Gammaproteobacteria bacterium]
MSHPNSRILLAVACLGMLLSTAVFSASAKRIERSIAADQLEHIDFEISVAEMDIEIYDGNEIQLDISLKADRDWWIFGRNDVDDVDLTVYQDGNRIELVLDDDDIEQDWRVRLPVHLAISMDIGVGEVSIENLANDLRLDMGVGAVQINVADIDYDRIHLQTGVGDSSLRGFGRSTDNERNIVGADSYYQGEGEYQISVELGVGDTQVRRR